MQMDSQGNLPSSKGKEIFSSQNINRDFYNTSILRPNSLSDICNDLSPAEALDINVEKFLAEMADNFMETVIDTACQIAKHKKTDEVARIHSPSEHANALSTA